MSYYMSDLTGKSKPMLTNNIKYSTGKQTYS